jgi:chemotaxis protein CheX
MVATEADNVREELIVRLDSAVSEVFEMMLDRSCAPLDAEVDIDIDKRITARIRFSGSITGECLVYASQTVAQIAAEALLGTVSEPCDPMVDGAIGELCNMIAGGWKSKLESSRAVCLISVPAVTRDAALGLDAQFGTTYSRCYSFQGNVFGVSLAF